MRIRSALALCFVIVCLAPAAAAAQETRKVGITMGYPAAVGVLWHASSRLALRPELTFNGTSSHTTTEFVNAPIPDIEIESRATVIGTGVSALFYLRTDDRLRLYVSPRFTYTHTTGSATGTTTNVPTSSEETIHLTAGSGSFGAQYALGDRFGIFGEVGVAFSHSSSSYATERTQRSGNAWGTRAGVGIVFYP